MKKEHALNVIIVFVIFSLILGISSLPDFFGNLNETDELVFLGAYADTADYSVHLSIMQAGWLGDWKYQMRYTTEEHIPASIRLFYIFLGHVSRWFNIDVELAFHTARWLFGYTALATISILFKKILINKKDALAAFFLAVFGAGLGWLQLALKISHTTISPIDFWFISAYTLFSVSLFPSFSFTLALMTLAIYFFLLFLENGKWYIVAIIIILAMTSQLFNPISFATIDASIASIIFFNWWFNKKANGVHILGLGFIAFSQIPLLIYNFLILSQDPVWKQFTLQNQTLSPPFIFYVWGFAPFWIFVLFGLLRSFREKNLGMIAMCIWIISGFTLAYLPVLIQRRFLLGITIPMGAVAMYGFNYFIDGLPDLMDLIKKRKNLLYFGYILFASISSILLILNSSLSMFNHPKSLFYPRDIKIAAEWLDIHSSPNEFVLAAVETSQIIAQQTFLKMYVGHEMETLYFSEKENAMELFFKNNNPNNWLSQTPIKWVIYGPYEKEISNVFYPSKDLNLVYENKSVKIYKVR